MHRQRCVAYFCSCAELFPMKLPKSIRTLNWAFLTAATLFNLVLIVVSIVFLRDNSPLLVAFVACNFASLIIVVAYFFMGKQYISDIEMLLLKFQKALNTQSYIKIPTTQNPMFIENKKLEWLFRQALLKNNLIHKDYFDLKEVFTKFVPDDIYKEIGYRGYEKIALWSCVSKRLTVMFLDIMGFTRISETLTPDKTLLLLNIYFDGIGEIVYRHNGYIDKFLGDGIMIIFDQETSDSALICAMEIIRFMNKFRISSFWQKIDVGIGINSWDVIVGTIGTKKRMDATVIGDNVNIAARLQSLTRKHKKNIITSQSTIDLIQDKTQFSLHSLGEEILTGKEYPVGIWSVDETNKKS